MDSSFVRMVNKTVKPIENKIRTPFLILIVLFALITLLLFNIAIRVYLERSARNELQAVVKTMEVTVKNEFIGNFQNFTDRNLDRAFVKLYRALNSSKLSVNTEMLLFDRHQELLYPQDETDSYISKRLVEQISTLLPSIQEKKIYTIRIGVERHIIYHIRSQI